MQGSNSAPGTPNRKNKDATATRQLSLVKGKERFVFRYQTGQEATVIDTFASMAADKQSGFDWFDAAVLSYQMGRRLEKELDPVAVLPGEHGR